MTTQSFREHDPKHPYVLKYTGCGHGRPYSEPCVDCEIVGLHERHRYAARTIARVRDRLRELAAPPADKLLCDACERNAVLAGLPSAYELAGRHVHLGKLKAVQTCCAGKLGAQNGS